MIVYSFLRMIRALGTLFAGLLGLAFGSFLNVCLSRWPEGESVVRPASHCSSCERVLAWWENIPLLSWLALRGQCRTCGTWIGLRHPLVEAAVGLLWASCAWSGLPSIFGPAVPAIDTVASIATLAGKMAFYWLLIALAVLDSENFWLPNWLTLPGTALGFLYAALIAFFPNSSSTIVRSPFILIALNLLGIVVAAGLVLLIRWVYWLVRRQEGMGLGDAKLMAMLAAWLGLPGALLSFGIGVVLGALYGLVLALPAARREHEQWGASKLPLGTFLCIGGIVSSFWGEQIIGAYLRWAGL